MHRYKGYLQNTDTTSSQQEISAGSHNLLFTFSWPVNEQTQFDTLETNIKAAANNDPLVLEDGNYKRDYDYVDFWLHADVAETTIWPLSAMNKTEAGKQAYIQEKQAECLVLDELREQYKELLFWNFTCDDGEKVTTGLLHLGGWFCYNEGSYSFRFNSEKEEIGINDLGYAQIEVLTDD